MSIDAAREFLLRAEANEDIRSRLKGIELRDAAGIAREFGYECDGAELMAVAEETENDEDYALDLDELSLVAGGGSNNAHQTSASSQLCRLNYRH